MERKYFYCYSYPLKQFFIENGLESVAVAVHPKTGKRYWMFESSEKLTECLEKWRANR